jgi:bifunctional DNA-binding transcriptional regulator/antitoxin component of YhaV-PrlF toxin-antitoxin module
MCKYDILNFILMSVGAQKKSSNIREYSPHRQRSLRNGLLVQLKQRGQITIPVSVRDAVSVSEGALFEVGVQRGAIILEPKDVVQRHPDIDKEIQKGLADIRAGRVTPAFSSMKEFKAYRKTADYKKLLASE